MYGTSPQTCTSLHTSLRCACLCTDACLQTKVCGCLSSPKPCNKTCSYYNKMLKKALWKSIVLWYELVLNFSERKSDFKVCQKSALGIWRHIPWLPDWSGVLRSLSQVLQQCFVPFILEHSEVSSVQIFSHTIKYIFKKISDIISKRFCEF